MEVLIKSFSGQWDEINGIWFFPSDEQAQDCFNQLKENIKDKEFTLIGDVIMEETDESSNVPTQFTSGAD